MYNREATEIIKKINSTFRVLLVTGPRQTGKTTLLKKFKTRKYGVCYIR